MTEEKPALAACCLTVSAPSLAVNEPIWTPHLLLAAEGGGLGGAGCLAAGLDGEGAGVFCPGWAAGGEATGGLFVPEGDETTVTGWLAPTGAARTA